MTFLPVVTRKEQMVFNNKRAVVLENVFGKWLSMFLITIGTFLSVVITIIWNGLHKKESRGTNHEDWFSEW